MLFNSLQFIFVFLPVALAVFWLIPAHRRTERKLWMCAASVAFYAYWNLTCVALLSVSIGFNYGIAEAINRMRGRSTARLALGFGVAANLILLGYFKYTNFFVSVVDHFAHHQWGPFDIVLPLAISFFTFTQIGYLVDVSRDAKLHYGFLDYVVFVVFFPHLIAGPIVRHWEIIPQYAAQELHPRRSDFGAGAAMFLLGLFKKVLIADTVAAYANGVYGMAAAGVMIPCLDAWFGTVAYALQIYFDFSGYSDMAIGLARMFGIRFPGNFNSPYKADSIAEFWQRWHMSLTRFLREYVYIPLGGNRRGHSRQILNVIITFLLSGLWHGAGWTFVIWGLLHGTYLVAGLQWRRFLKWRGWEPKHWSYRGACVLLTFIAVLIAWVFFRAPNFSVAGQMLSSMFGAQGLTLSSHEHLNANTTLGHGLMALGFKFVPVAVGVEEYTRAVVTVFLFLLWVWFVPNTQQWLAAWRPLLEEDPHPCPVSLPLKGWTGAILGLGLFLVVRSFFSAPNSPFLYFNF